MPRASSSTRSSQAGRRSQALPARRLRATAELVVSTAGSLGGWAQPGGPYEAAAPPGRYDDAYGAGDCFAAGLACALAKGMDVTEALVFASEPGALALTRKGAGALP